MRRLTTLSSLVGNGLVAGRSILKILLAGIFLERQVHPLLEVIAILLSHTTGPCRRFLNIYLHLFLNLHHHVWRDRSSFQPTDRLRRGFSVADELLTCLSIYIGWLRLILLEFSELLFKGCNIVLLAVIYLVGRTGPNDHIVFNRAMCVS